MFPSQPAGDREGNAVIGIAARNAAPVPGLAAWNAPQADREATTLA
jgi:hypothetical protein